MSCKDSDFFLYYQILARKFANIRNLYYLCRTIDIILMLTYNNTLLIL